MIRAMTDAEKSVFCKLNSYYPTTRFKGIIRIVGEKRMAMVGFDDFTYNSCQMHIAMRNAHGLSRYFIGECFRYVFQTCNLGLVIGVTPCNNTRALELNRRLGFRRILTIQDGYALGTDLAIQEMRREECRWLTKRIVPNGIEEPSSPSS